MNFRKVVFALATAGLGLTGIASAQINCTGGLNAPVPTIRAEGTTEAVATMTITSCTGTPNTGSVSISVSSSAPIANIPGSGGSTPSGATDATATLLGSPAVHGVIQGSTIVFTFDTTTVGSGNTVVITGVRVNASGQAVGANITASVASSTGLNLGGTGVYSNVAVANPSHAVGAPVVGGFSNQAICTAPSTPLPILEAQVSNAFFGAFAPSAGGTLFIQVTFSNLAPGVNYYVPTSLAAGATGGLSGTLVTSTAVPIAPATGVTAGSSSGVHVDNVVKLSVSGGSATAIYNLTTSSPGANESFIVPLYAVVPSGSTVGVNGPGMVTAQLVGAATGYDGFAAPSPAPTPVAAKAGTGLADVTQFVGGPAPGVPNGTGELTSCATTLLFPYVLNVGGYDTGIALTNSTATIGTSQDGTCSVQFFGSGAPTTNPYVTDSIKAGTVGAFTVSTVASGFQGYAIASCNFGDAHGFAFITDGFGTAGRGLSQGYLAIVTARGGSALTNVPF